jgi:alkylation response protein AidB-like acyl-CoA dehydrogenase
MNFMLSEKQKILQGRAREFVEEECLPLEREFPDAFDPLDLPIERIDHIKKEVIRRGLNSLSTPRKYGGQGLGLTEKCLVREQFNRAELVFMHPHLYSVGMEPPEYVWTDGSQYQQEEFFTPAAKGDKIFNFCFSEPSAGSDLSAMRTTAVKKGDVYVINGIKRWTESFDQHGLSSTGFVIVYAKTNPEAGSSGVSSFIVPYGTPGMRESQVIQTWALGFLRDVCDITFENCAVPATHLIGAENTAFSKGRKFLNKNVLFICAGMIGTAQRAFDKAKEYAQKRVAFGKPIGEHQAIAWMVAESAVDLHLARLLVYHAAWAYDKGDDVRQYVAMSKGWIPDMLCRVIDRAIQIHGGLGITKRLRLESAYRGVRSSKLAEGTTEIYHMVLSRCINAGNYPLSMWQ